mmetsp:Transcript_29200/g.86426  ORF Transcript_29200/g.86426 Transcript_29200/m.86426 type:complete len:886 (+) Transcript_29200:474-3131(+)
MASQNFNRGHVTIVGERVAPPVWTFFPSPCAHPPHHTSFMAASTIEPTLRPMPTPLHTLPSHSSALASRPSQVARSPPRCLRRNASARSVAHALSSASSLGRSPWRGDRSASAPMPGEPSGAVAAAAARAWLASASKTSSDAGMLPLAVRTRLSSDNTSSGVSARVAASAAALSFSETTVSTMSSSSSRGVASRRVCFGVAATFVFFDRAVCGLKPYGWTARRDASLARSSAMSSWAEKSHGSGSLEKKLRACAHAGACCCCSTSGTLACSPRIITCGGAAAAAAGRLPQLAAAAAGWPPKIAAPAAGRPPKLAAAAAGWPPKLAVARCTPATKAPNTPPDDFLGAAEHGMQAGAAPLGARHNIGVGAALIAFKWPCKPPFRCPPPPAFHRLRPAGRASGTSSRATPPAMSGSLRSITPTALVCGVTRPSATASSTTASSTRAADGGPPGAGAPSAVTCSALVSDSRQPIAAIAWSTARLSPGTVGAPSSGTSISTRPGGAAPSSVQPPRAAVPARAAAAVAPGEDTSAVSLRLAPGSHPSGNSSSTCSGSLGYSRAGSTLGATLRPSTPRNASRALVRQPPGAASAARLSPPALRPMSSPSTTKCASPPLSRATAWTSGRCAPWPMPSANTEVRAAAARHAALPAWPRTSDKIACSSDDPTPPSVRNTTWRLAAFANGSLSYTACSTERISVPPQLACTLCCSHCTASACVPASYRRHASGHMILKLDPNIAMLNSTSLSGPDSGRSLTRKSAASSAWRMGDPPMLPLPSMTRKICCGGANRPSAPAARGAGSRGTKLASATVLSSAPRVTRCSSTLPGRSADGWRRGSSMSSVKSFDASATDSDNRAMRSPGASPSSSTNPSAGDSIDEKPRNDCTDTVYPSV